NRIRSLLLPSYQHCHLPSSGRSRLTAADGGGMTGSSSNTTRDAALERPWRIWLGLAVLLSGTFMTVMDVFIVNVAIPSIRADLGASYAAVELIVAGYGLAYAILLITGGRLGDVYGRRRMFVAGLLAFTMASALCGLAPDATALVATRILQGLAAAI